MKSRFLTSWSLVWFFVALMLVAGGGLNLFQRSFGKIPPTDGVVWIQKKDGIYAEKVILGLPAARSGITVGDKLLGIGLDDTTEEIESPSDIQMFLDLAGVGGSLTYFYQRPSYTFENNFYYADLRRIDSFPRWPPPYLFLLLVGIVWLAVGIFVLAKQGSGSPFVIHFATLCLTAFIFHIYRPLGSAQDFDLAVSIIDNWAFVFFASLFMHFCLRYPIRSEVFDEARWKNRMIYIPAAILALITFSLSLYSFLLPRFVSDVLVSAINRWDLIGWSDRLNLYFFITGISVGAIVLIRRFILSKQTIVRQRLKWAMWGTIAAGLPILLFQTVKIFTTIPDDDWIVATTTLPLALIPLSFGHSVVRYRLMDVDVVVRRALVYAMTTIAISAMIGGVALGVIFLAIGENLSGTELFVRSLIAIVAMSVIVLLSEPIKRFLQERTERFFYGERYDLRRGLLDFGRTLSATTALDPLLDALTRRLQQVLDVEKVAVFIEDETTTSGYRVARLIGINDYAISNDFKQMIRTKSAAQGVVRADQLDLNDIESTQTNGFTPQELHYFVPCVVRGRMVAVIGMGRASDGSLLTSEDLDILRTVSGYVAVAIENSLLYQEQERRAQELEILKEFNESIVESVNVALLAVDETGRITRCNSTFEEMFALPRETAVGKEVEDVFGEVFTDALDEVFGEQLWTVAEPKQAYKLNALAKNGSKLILNLAVAPLRSHYHDQTGAIIVLENVTERVQLEESLQQSEKLSSIGLLAAGIAHEVNTPLTGVSSYTQMLLEMIPEDDPKHALLLKVQKQTDRASLIAANLLNFSRAGNIADFHPVEMNRLLEDTLQLLEPQLRASEVEIRKNYAENLPIIHGSSAKLQQVFTNLILNARDAMNPGGHIKLDTFEAAGNVVIQVSDTGKGIADEDISKIYDPFFTTKGVGSGTGLGLAVSYGIIQEHRGTIEAVSEVGIGTTFKITLPLNSNGSSSKEA
jgi:two-component system, NtrC family, sensor kinase